MAEDRGGREEERVERGARSEWALSHSEIGQPIAAIHRRLASSAPATTLNACPKVPKARNGQPMLSATRSTLCGLRRAKLRTRKPIPARNTRVRAACRVERRVLGCFLRSNGGRLHGPLLGSAGSGPNLEIQRAA